MSIKKILIADDDETTIDSLILWIESIKDFKDAQILTSMDPEQTEAAILKEMPELVFLDFFVFVVLFVFCVCVWWWFCCICLWRWRSWRRRRRR